MLKDKLLLAWFYFILFFKWLNPIWNNLKNGVKSSNLTAQKFIFLNWKKSNIELLFVLLWEINVNMLVKEPGLAGFSYILNLSFQLIFSYNLIIYIISNKLVVIFQFVCLSVSFLFLLLQIYFNNDKSMPIYYQNI